MSSEFQRMQHLAGINEVRIVPSGKTYYAVFNWYREPFYIITHSPESMLNKLNKAFKELTGNRYRTPYELDDFNEERKGMYKTYISDDWSTVTDDKNVFDREMSTFDTPPKKYTPSL